MRRGAAILLALVFVVSAPPAHAQTSGSRLVIAVLLRAAGDDAISACQDSKLADPKPLEQMLIRAFAPTGKFSQDNNCITLHADQPLTRRTLGHSRAFRVTPNLQSALSSSYKEASLIICTPLLTDSIRIFEGRTPTVTESCRFGGYKWDALQPLDFELTIAATSHDVERGILGGIAWILGLAMLVALAVRQPRPLLKRNSVISALMIIFLSGVALDGWVQVAYYSHLLHSLQLNANIGESGGAALLAIPAGLSALAVAFAGVLFTRGEREPIGPIESTNARQVPGSLHAADTILPFGVRPPRPEKLAVMLIPPFAFFIAFAMFVTYLGGAEVKVEGMIATLFAYGFVSRYFARGLLPFLHDAKPIDSERRASIVVRLRGLGAPQRQILVSRIPPAATPLGGSILSVGDRVTIWEPLLSLSDEELAGAIALRSAHVRGWPTSLGLLIATLAIAIPTRSDGHIPLFVIALPVVVLVAMGVRDIITNIRVRDRAVHSTEVESHIRGLLAAARSTARLAAAGSLGVVAIKAPTYAAATWSRALKQSEVLAREARLPADRVAQIADEIRWHEFRLTDVPVRLAQPPLP